jgi:hypothetical protein
MLTGQERMVTMHMKTVKICDYGKTWYMLKRYFPYEITDHIKNMRIKKDSKGCVFDLNEENVDYLLRLMKESKHDDPNIIFTIERCTNMPDLQNDGDFDIAANL